MSAWGGRFRGRERPYIAARQRKGRLMTILNRIPTGAATAVATLCLFVGCSAQAPFQANESEALGPESPEISEDSSPLASSSKTGLSHADDASLTKSLE